MRRELATAVVNIAMLIVAIALITIGSWLLSGGHL